MLRKAAVRACEYEYYIMYSEYREKIRSVYTQVPTTYLGKVPTFVLGLFAELACVSSVLYTHTVGTVLYAAVQYMPYCSGS